MEYALLSLYYGFQKLFNLLLNIEVVNGVTVGGIIAVFIILSGIFASFGFMDSVIVSRYKSFSKANKGKRSDGG